MADSIVTDLGLSLAAIEDRYENPIKYLNSADIHAVTSCIERAAYSLLAVHRLAHETLPEGAEWNLLAIEELARSTFRRLDACVMRLEGGPGIGNFASEFEDEEPVDEEPSGEEPAGD